MSSKVSLCRHLSVAETYLWGSDDLRLRRLRRAKLSRLAVLKGYELRRLRSSVAEETEELSSRGG